MKRRYNIFIQCQGEDGRIGSFLKDTDGDQVTITFSDLVNLFNSTVYKQLKEQGLVNQ